MYTTVSDCKSLVEKEFATELEHSVAEMRSAVQRMRNVGSDFPESWRILIEVIKKNFVKISNDYAEFNLSEMNNTTMLSMKHLYTLLGWDSQNPVRVPPCML